MSCISGLMSKLDKNLAFRQNAHPSEMSFGYVAQLVRAQHS